MGTNWSRKSQRAFSRRSVPRTVPVTEESNPISEETDPGCGIVQEKVVAVSSCNQQPTGWEQFESTQQKKKKKGKFQRNHSLVLHHPLERKNPFLCQVHCWLQMLPASFAHSHFERIFLSQLDYVGMGWKLVLIPKNKVHSQVSALCFTQKGPARGYHSVLGG